MAFPRELAHHSSAIFPGIEPDPMVDPSGSFVVDERQVTRTRRLSTNSVVPSARYGPP